MERMDDHLVYRDNLLTMRDLLIGEKESGWPSMRVILVINYGILNI
jgi:hypothetical protein